MIEQFLSLGGFDVLQSFAIPLSNETLRTLANEILNKPINIDLLYICIYIYMYFEAKQTKTQPYMSHMSFPKTKTCMRGDVGLRLVHKPRNAAASGPPLASMSHKMASLEFVSFLVTMGGLKR